MRTLPLDAAKLCIAEVIQLRKNCDYILRSQYDANFATLQKPHVISQFTIYVDCSVITVESPDITFKIRYDHFSKMYYGKLDEDGKIIESKPFRVHIVDDVPPDYRYHFYLTIEEVLAYIDSEIFRTRDTKGRPQLKKQKSIVGVMNDPVMLNPLHTGIKFILGLIETNAQIASCIY